MESLATIGLLGITGISAYTDFKTGKIKNKVLLLGLIIGITYNLLFSGIEGLFFSLKGIVVPFLLLFLFFAIGGLGAGDIKLFSTIGAFMGVKFVLNTIALSMIVGIVIMIFSFMIGKDIFRRIWMVFKTFYISILSRKFLEFQNKENKKVIPFAISIFIAILCQVMLKINIF